MADPTQPRTPTPGERDILESEARSRARLESMLARMRTAQAVEAVGMVDDIVGFGSGPEASISLTLAPWRWLSGPVEQGALYVRIHTPAIQENSSRELRHLRTRLPRFSLARLTVRPDVSRRSGGELWDCLLEGIAETPPTDEELRLLAEHLKAAEPPEKLGRPALDIQWLIFDLLARFLPVPDIDVVHLGQPLPPGNWQEQPQAGVFDECEIFERIDERGRIRVGIHGGTVEGVFYDLDVYRESGRHQMRKLQTLLKLHAVKTGKLHRFHDNQHGAMMYRDQPGKYFAIYGYNADVFILHSDRTSWRRPVS